jgi:hypothetical protein
LVLAVGLLVGLVLVADSGRDARPAADTGSEEARPQANSSERGPAVEVRARYYRTKGPCVQIGDALVMPVVHGFEVVGVEAGALPGRRIEVLPHSGPGPDRPWPLVEGAEYRLRLTLSERTRREWAQPGRAVLWVDADEVAQVPEIRRD